MAQQSSQYPSATDDTNNLVISNSPDMSTGDNIVSIGTGLEDEREKILKWLSPVEPYQQHQTARAQRPDGVGDWLLETHGFLKWSGSSPQDGCVHTVLGCSAEWGIGKTHLR
ncbi:hypothetical protein L873DRAFT_1791534 [Choiromyces venosus 120613-1]|uniref:Uncharacterized protein n=1 Tax=Choiromyces venosus 120613-1 TaxID=1336337 RepID=A0A3N4JE49_9PEZI|nr:hypothetical protein L873DRAFT_1791534 [Choiromyces venosus 120613-1]